MMPTLGQTFAFVADLVKNKTDKSGEPYIMHLIYVAGGMKTTKQRIYALLHDSVEDDELDFDTLIEMGYPQDYIRTLDCLTHRTGEDYMTYIRRVSFDEDAKEIKKKDLEHNSQITRLKGLRQKDFDRLEKYNRAYVYLS